MNLNVGLSQEAAVVETLYQYKFSANPTTLNYSYESTDESKSTTVTSERRSITITNGSVTSTGSYTNWTSWSGSITHNPDDAFQKVNNSTVKVVKANNDYSTRLGDFVLTQTQSSICTISGYESDDSTIGINLSQSGKPQPPDCIIYNNISPMRVVWCFGENGTPTVQPPSFPSVGFPTLQGGDRHGWYSRDGGVYMYNLSGIANVFVKMNDMFWVRGSDNGHWTNPAMYYLTGNVNIASDFN